MKTFLCINGNALIKVQADDDYTAAKLAAREFAKTHFDNGVVERLSCVWTKLVRSKFSAARYAALIGAKDTSFTLIMRPNKGPESSLSVDSPRFVGFELCFTVKPARKETKP